MDFTQYYILLSVLGGLVVGYLIKNTPVFSKVANDYIPVIVAIVGAVVACLTQGLTVENVIYGAISGLASTGLHQAFKTFIGNQE